MSVIDLPGWPGARDATPRVLDFGGFLEPPTGAEEQRINRLGNRYAVSFIMPPLTGKDGRIWVNRLVRGRNEGARIEYPLLDFDPGAPNLANGTPIMVDGNGQAGRLLHIRNVTPRYAFLEGQPFSLEIGGQHYLDFIAAPVIVGADGKATILLSQMLRQEPIDGNVLHVTKPMIEGWVKGSETAWNLALNRTVGLEFEIHERR